MENLRKRLEKGEYILGTHSFLGSTHTLEILSGLSFDFIFLCAEHTPCGTEKMYDLVKTCQKGGTHALVRVPQNDLTFTKKVLEMGVDAVLFPMIRTAEEAKLAMDACLYPPLGTRGFGPMGAVRWGLDSEKAFVDGNLNGTLRLIQIEHIDAVNNLEEIVKNPYIDGYVFGPNDLAASIGHICDMYHPEVKKELERAARILNKANKAIGVALVSYTKEDIDYWKKLGVRIFSLGSDSKYIKDSAIELYSNANSLIR